MQQLTLIFDGPQQTTVEKRALPEPADNEVLVANRLSAISAGTEMLVFNGKIPAGMAVDSKIPSIAGRFEYPLSYGYSSVGQVIATGSPVNEKWIGRNVFAFQPHASYFTAEPDTLLPLPTECRSRMLFFWRTWKPPSTW